MRTALMAAALVVLFAVQMTAILWMSASGEQDRRREIELVSWCWQELMDDFLKGA